MLRVLIAKEWRENRWLMLGFLVLTPILSLGLKLGIMGWIETSAEDTMCLILPGMRCGSREFGSTRASQESR